MLRLIRSVAAPIIALIPLAAGCTRETPTAADTRSDSAVETTAITVPKEGARETKLATDRRIGELELYATFDGPMPTGVTVSQDGRVFVNFPRWGDAVDFTVAEVKDGKPVPYPDKAINTWPAPNQATAFVSVQSVVVDPAARLWVLDTGSVKMGPTTPGGPKLVGIDLASNKVVKTITFPTSVALPTTYLNDVRFDLRRGKGGTAFITDSSGEGPNGIIVVDLDSGKSWRRLNDHPSTKASPGFLAFVEGRELVQREPGKSAKPPTMGADGIAISADGKTLYFCPLSSRRLYSVSTDALANQGMSDSDVAKTVKDLGDKGASDGLESDADGRVYATQYENDAIVRRKLDGSFETLVKDERALWPDTMSLAPDGYLYFTANQLHRQPQYQGGQDLRRKPYALFRLKIDARPVLLR